MNLAYDEKRVETVYKDGSFPKGRDRFDMRDGILMTLDQAKKLIINIDFNNHLTSVRNKILAVYMSPLKDYLEWEVEPTRLSGIIGFNENAESLTINGSLYNFISRSLEDRKILGILAMDRLSREVIQSYQTQYDRFDSEIFDKGKGIAVGRK